MYENMSQKHDKTCMTQAPQNKVLSHYSQSLYDTSILHLLANALISSGKCFNFISPSDSLNILTLTISELSFFCFGCSSIIICVHDMSCHYKNTFNLFLLFNLCCLLPTSPCYILIFYCHSSLHTDDTLLTQLSHHEDRKSPFTGNVLSNTK